MGAIKVSEVAGRSVLGARWVAKDVTDASTAKCRIANQDGGFTHEYYVGAPTISALLAILTGLSLQLMKGERIEVTVWDIITTSLHADTPREVYLGIGS